MRYLKRRKQKSNYNHSFFQSSPQFEKCIYSCLSRHRLDFQILPPGSLLHLLSLDTYNLSDFLDLFDFPTSVLLNDPLKELF